MRSRASRVHAQMGPNPLANGQTQMKKHYSILSTKVPFYRDMREVKNVAKILHLMNFINLIAKNMNRKPRGP